MQNQRPALRYIRYGAQLYFFLFTLFIGYRFFAFVSHFEAGTPFVERPASVDGFLPIAGLMSFKYFLFTGIIEPFHPAAMVIFGAALAVSFLMKKGFCGWICPVGTVSQYVWMGGEKIFRRNFRMEKHTDIAVRSVKYMLMFLFLLLIGVAMAPHMMVLFFLGDYYKVADIKTMKFFTEMSTTAFWSLAVITGMSLIYKNFWCRYLCPYGALLGLLSKASPVKVRRNDERCVHCRACSRHCPTLIDVEKQEIVSSAECFGCLTCVSRCPAPGALEITVKTTKARKVFSPYLFPVFLLAIFYVVIGAAMLSGHWQTNIPYEEYRRIIPTLSTLSHP